MSLEAGRRCPRCEAARVPGPECPRCGVIYAKARPTVAAAHELAVALPGDAVPEPSDAAIDAARRELLIRACAPPLAVLLAAGLVASDLGHAVVRLCATMWLHELGHAATAWICGYGAFPGPWFTPVSAGRSAGVIVFLGAALAALAWYGWRARRTRLLVAALAGLTAQLACSLLSPTTARALITFGGDGGAIVLGAALAMTMWSDPQGPLGRGALRWGFLGIGAAALVDVLDTWIRAWRDHDRLPLGEIEGVGLSDASRLMEVHGWSADALAGRHVILGMAALVLLGAASAAALVRARSLARGAAGRP